MAAFVCLLQAGSGREGRRLSDVTANVPMFYRTLFCYLCVDFTVYDDIQPGAVCGEAYNAEFSLGVSAGAGRKYVLGAADSQ